VAFGFVLLLLLHFSLAVSRLSDQTKILAQRLALVEQQQRTRQDDALPTTTRHAPEHEVAAVGASERITRN